LLARSVAEQEPELQRLPDGDRAVSNLEASPLTPFVLLQLAHDRRAEAEAGRLQVVQDVAQVGLQVEREREAIVQPPLPRDQLQPIRRLACDHQPRQDRPQQGAQGRRALGGVLHSKRAEFDQPEHSAPGFFDVPQLLHVDRRAVAVARSVGEKRGERPPDRRRGRIHVVRQEREREAQLAEDVRAQLVGPDRLPERPDVVVRVEV
jgi:hypothetical protein